MSVNVDVLATDHDFEETPIWSPFLDKQDLEVLAEALDFYLEALEPRDPMVISVTSLIRHLRINWPFTVRMGELFEKRLAKERKNATRNRI